MTKIKLCGCFREEDIQTANILHPDYIGFVFFKKSHRYVAQAQALKLKRLLSPTIRAVGVFVNEDIENVMHLLSEGIIDLAQLHGDEDEDYILRLQERFGKPVIKAFVLRKKDDIIKAEKSPAGHILLDAGMGDGTTLNWDELQDIRHPYFLAGGLDPENVINAVKTLHPFAVDVSSGIETNRIKDPRKMEAFVNAVRRIDHNG